MAEQRHRVAIYSRKSRFTGRGESIGNQVELCRDYIRAHSSQNDAEEALVFEDEGFSGGNLNRPRFREMMAAAKRGEVSSVVVYRLDRISRNIGDFAGLIEELHRLEVTFVSIREQFDTESPMGRAMMYIASVFSQLERETTAERIRDNLRELAKTGRWLGGVTPTGYASEEVRQITVDGRARKACRLREIPEEAALVRSVFETYLKTSSLTETDALLLRSGLVTKNGKRFTRFAIRGILSNPVYMMADADAWHYLTEKGVELFSDREAFDGKHGIMAYNRTVQQKGKSTKLRPESEWIVSVGKHPGFIPGRSWSRVQELLELNRSRAYRKPRSHAALLPGLLVCGGCGQPMRPKQTGRRNERGEETYQYLCTLKERSKSACCAMHNADGNQLDEAMLDMLMGQKEDFGEFFRRLGTGAPSSGEAGGAGGEMDPLRAALDANEREINRLVDTLGKASGTAAEDYILGKVQELHTRGERLREGLRETECPTLLKESSPEELQGLARKFASLQETVEDMTVEERRALLRACVQKVVWDGENAHVCLLGADTKAQDAAFAPGFFCKPSGEDSK